MMKGAPTPVIQILHPHWVYYFLLELATVEPVRLTEMLRVFLVTEGGVIVCVVTCVVVRKI